LNRYRAKLVRLQARRTEYIRLDTSERDMIDGEETTLYHLIKSKKRREARRIRRTQDQRGRITEDPTEISQIFVAHLKDKYSSIDVSDSCVAEMLNAIQPNTQPPYAAYLEQPITAEELYAALISEGPNKALGSDGISREIYIRLWDTIREDMLGVMNKMYIHKSMTRRQQHGIIVSLPKDDGDITPAGYRPITLMNTNYKLLARIMARRTANTQPILLRTGQIHTSGRVSAARRRCACRVDAYAPVYSLAGFQKCLRLHLASLFISNLGGICT
jgi:hypothetical protein